MKMRLKNESGLASPSQGGQAALIAVLFMLAIMLSAVFGAASVALKEQKISDENKRSRSAYFAAEAGVDDAVYRSIRGKNVSSSIVLLLNGAVSTTTVTTIGGVRTISSEGSGFGAIRGLAATLSTITGVTFHYGVQVGDEGVSMANNTTVNGSVFSNGNITGGTKALITGDATVAEGNTMNGVTVGDANSGTARAGIFINTTAHGSSCPNQYCVVANSPSENMPVSDDMIRDWKNIAVNGGTVSGYALSVNGSSGSLGPKKINGDLTLANNVTLTITGTLWVTGNINFSNGCNVNLSPAYGSAFGVIVTDGTVSISNNCTFQGSGVPGTYIMLLSTKSDAVNAVMTINNNSVGVIYYAQKGIIDFANGAKAKEATGYGLSLSPNASVTYESGLANAQFSSGPSGGWWIASWGEFAP